MNFNRVPPSFLGFPGGSAVKESTCNLGDLNSIPGLGRSSGKGKGYPLQYCGLENSTDCIVHGIAKSQTQLNDFHFPSYLPSLLSFPLPSFPLSLFVYSRICKPLLPSVGKESACNAGDTGLIPGLERSAGEVIAYTLQYSWASLVAQLVKNLLATRETWIQSLGWEDPPGEGKGYPLQYSGLENSMDSIIHEVANSLT